MNLTEQLAQLSEANSNVMGPTEVKSKRATDLYNAFLKAQDVAAAAPDDLREAEVAYYTYIQGEDGYAYSKSKQRAAEFEKIRKDLVRMYNESKSRVNSSLEAYDSTRTYAENLNSVSMQIFENLKTALTNQTIAQSVEQKGHRQSFYIDEETIVVKTVNIAFNLLLISLAVVFWKVYAYDTGHFFSPVAWVGGVFILFSSLLISTIVFQIMSVKPPKNVYTSQRKVWSGTTLSKNYTY